VGDQLPSLSKKAKEGNEMTQDPHWWNSVSDTEKATMIVRDAFVHLDGQHAADYQAAAQAYLNSLQELDSWARRKIAELPRNQRKLVTSHDAFQYFAKGFKSIRLRV
jgi:zinc/manganese transport system substrate-binding protein